MVLKKLLIGVKGKTDTFLHTARTEFNALARPAKVVIGIKRKKPQSLSSVALLKKNPFERSKGGIL